MASAASACTAYGRWTATSGSQVRAIHSTAKNNAKQKTAAANPEWRKKRAAEARASFGGAAAGAVSADGHPVGGLAYQGKRPQKGKGKGRQQQHPPFERDRQELTLPEEIADQDRHEASVLFGQRHFVEQLPSPVFQFSFVKVAAAIERFGEFFAGSFDLFAHLKRVRHFFEMAGALPLAAALNRSFIVHVCNLVGLCFFRGVSGTRIRRCDGHVELLS